MPIFPDFARELCSVDLFQESLDDFVGRFAGKERTADYALYELGFLRQSIEEQLSAAKKSLFQAMHALARRVWEGQYGQGNLVVLSQDEHNRPVGEPYFRLARLLDVSPDQRFAADLAGRPYFHYSLDGLVVRGGPGEVFVPFLSSQRPHYGPLGRDREQLLHWTGGVAEVALGRPTEEELRALYARLSFRLSLSEQLEVFGREVGPE